MIVSCAGMLRGQSWGAKIGLRSVDGWHATQGGLHMHAEPGEPRYSARELFELFLAFNRDTRERQRMYKQNLSPQQHAMPLIVQFIAYIRNQEYEQRIKEVNNELKCLEKKSKRHKGQMFGPPTDGMLFKEVP
jgi:hypothetical protein